MALVRLSRYQAILSRFSKDRRRIIMGKQEYHENRVDHLGLLPGAILVYQP